MKRIMEKVKEIIFGHVGICILLLCAGPFLFISHGIFREIEIEQAPFNSDEEDLIVVGVSQLGSESGWRTAQKGLSSNFPLSLSQAAQPCQGSRHRKGAPGLVQNATIGNSWKSSRTP